MKKILILALVVGLASLASAGVQLSVNGAPMASGDDIIAPAPVVIDAIVGTSDVQYTLKVETAGDLTLVTSGVVFDGSWMFGNGFTGGDPGDGATSAILSGGDFMPKGAGTGCFTGLGVIGTNGVITLTETTGPAGQLYDIVSTITVPEPMTMALLGLGGLFLRRRK